MDKSLWPRMRRMFSNDVIIRNVGGKQLRVIDIDHLQSFGQVQTNTLIDRYTRIHRSNRYNQLNPTLNYQTLRLQLYSDYEAMDTDGIIASVLDMVAEDCTTEDETGELLSIKSTNENIQRILYNLFYDVLNIDFNLAMWCRSMCKYGDLYLKLDIAEKFGVFNAKPMSVYDIIREEGSDPEHPSYVRYTYDPVSLMGGSSEASKNKQHYENYEMAHFRLITDTNYLPYGRSFVEPARKLFKQLTLLEDAALIHRIMRAPEKRIFYYNVGNIPSNEVDNFIQQQINSVKKTPYIDQRTGDYNLKFNMQNMIEDFHIPVRGNNDTSTKIDTAKGLEYAGMEDIEYLRDKMLAALKVPKAFLNYSDELNGKSTISALDVKWARGIGRIQKILISELRKIAIVHLYVQGFEDADLVNFELKLNNPSIILEQEKIALLKEKVDLANQMLEKNLLSTDYIYTHLFDLSEDQYNMERDLITEDVKRKFKWAQIENEGNDPEVSGVSYGTPHDLASQYGDKDDSAEVPSGYDEKQPEGRPKKHASIYGTQDGPGGRDPIGKKGMKDLKPDNKLNHTYKGGPMALEQMKKDGFKGKKVNINPLHGKRILLYEHKDEKINLLDESNIKEDIV